MDTTSVECLKNIISSCDNIVFFGGAGVSTESGIPDFRSTDGLYNQKYKFPPEVILSHDFFMRKTQDFYDFYKNKMIFPQAKPNTAHMALAELESRGKLRAVVTQNIDGLHQMAGSRNVLELHGSIHRNYCIDCGRFYSWDGISEKLEKFGVPHCDCGGTIKPDVVLYGETLDDEIMEKSAEYISNAEVLIIGGTSLGVYPAAGLISCFNARTLVVINKSPTPADGKANLVIKGSIGAALSGAIENLYNIEGGE